MNKDTSHLNVNPGQDRGRVEIGHKRSSSDFLSPNSALNSSHPPPAPTKSPRHIHPSPVPPIPTKSPRHVQNLKIDTDVDSSGTPTPGQRARTLSNTETFYPTQDSAKEALESERRHNPEHRRVPSPYTRQIRKVGSERSLRSRVSFDSGRRSAASDRSDGTDGATVGPQDVTRQVGAGGEAIEFIASGHRTPRHRKFSAGMLKPALRTSNGHHPTSAGHGNINTNSSMSSTRSRSRSRSRPTSSLPFSSNLFALGRQHSRHPSDPLTASPTEIDHPSSTSRPMGGHIASMSSVQSQAGSGIRGIFSSLSLEPRRPSQPPTLLLPADQLHAYLATAHVPNWTKWPVLPTSKGFFGKSKGFDAMSWEWKRRWQLAEEGRQFRTLRVWDVNREFEREALQFHQEKTPQHPIPFHDRWGKQIFALPAEGYETLEFFDEEANVADDHGLLSWLTNSLLATATSALHMTRFSSQSFSFHLIPAPYPPTPTSYVNERGTPKHCLWEGFGTLALVNRSQDSDRAMIIEIRPPSVVDSGVLNHFARQSRSEGWWHLPAELCVGDMGQANLLQAQVYDDCVSNHVFYFAVTNLKYWVFGRFNASYTMCTVSPIIERKQRNPSLMQCLTAWTISAYDDVS
ncbi:hypothetical protein TREMEDRAFT_26434 [Tremella mesenterica DSM 1558]|uniref:uncharacterized protein n=1 Tax=Tremella mesenterica (strain ATCC 24925 / CBS 8224 / DSM 1558 / NBRC 9311 / NRRL Y-6157 / RJB 2259-6 / UBC 559-6) TaxID=578456 RepID=UPI0003F4A530|nr:uncharacterized protein TREMEDRAFT_26434 [Tremella mesenterica DSM 1558]EIW72088.1 hypothetical protein TREMEDRAFT_26434 [Tremella mesenterica DSM 1558]